MWKSRTETDAGSVGFLHVLFFPVFHSQLSKCPKTRGKPKKTKKNNPVRRILGKSIQDCFFLFFLVYLVFLEVFALPSPTVQKLEENQKKKKTILWEESWVSPFRIVFFCFFWFIWFFLRFLLSQAQLSKNSRQQNYLCRKTYIYIRLSLQNRLSNYLFKRSWI